MVATSSFIVAASSIIPLAFGAPITRNPARSLAERASFAGYTVYGGDGTTGQGWPAQSSWLSFDDLWSLNKATIGGSCAAWGVADNSDSETSAIQSALKSVASSTGIAAEFLLAVMMQESKGCVRVPTTNYGVRNPGLFQDFNGDASCNDGGVQNPCPTSTITAMVQQGAGIGLQFGLQQAISQSAASDVSKYYKGARIFNSGSLPASGNLGQGVATHCYASDIANRLLGWVAQTSSCQEGTIGSISGTTGSTTTPGNTNDNTGNTNTTPSTTSTPTAAATSAAATTVAPAPSATATTTPTTGNSGTETHYSGASSSCTSWYDVKSGDTCESTGISFDTLRQLNSGIDANCSNLWAGYAYCIAA